jgi:tripartite-type tricarboxylate transporter receptor subunit TctC
MGKRVIRTAIICGVVFLFTLGGVAIAADTYPVKPIIFIVPNEAGSSADTMARALCQKIQGILGQPVMVSNKPGGGSSIGCRELHGAKPEGYTIGMSSGTIVTNKLQGLMPYDYRDYTVLGAYLNWGPALIASTKTKRPFNTFQEVISFAKANPDEVSIATGSVGQIWWIATTAFMRSTGLKFNLLPQTASSGITAVQVAGGHADLGVTDVTASKSQVDAGNVKVLAIFGSQRLPGKYSNIPTLKEFGYDINTYSTHVALGPPKMPKEITDRLVKTIESAANDPEFKALLAQNNALPLYLPPDQAIKWFDEQRKLYRDLMDKAGILKEK